MTFDRPLAVKTTPSVFLPIAFVAVALRCYVRLFIVKNFGWDDGAMVVSMAFFIMFCACMIGGSLYGTGQLEENLTWENVIIAKRFWWLCEVAFCLSSVAAKVSVCIFLLRITVIRIHRWILYTVMLLTVVSGIIFMLLMLLQCHPMSYFWDKHTQSGSCINMKIIVVMTYIYSAFSALCDFTVGLLPAFLVSSLNMNKQAKWAVAGILGMACIASSAVIIRLPYVTGFLDPEFLYATVGIAVWSNVEIGLGITAGSLATLRPLFRRFMNNRSGYSYSFPTKGTGAERLKSGGGGNSGNIGLVSMNNQHQNRTFPDGKLRPDVIENTVTVTHGSHSRSNSSERILMKDESNDLGNVGILRTFEVTSSEERVPVERV